MEKIQKEEMNRVYTQFSGGQVEDESYSVQMVLRHLLKGLLCCHMLTVDGEQVWSCEHTGKQSLMDYCQEYELGREELKWLWCGILEAILETENFLLEVDCLYLDVSEIYLDMKENQIRLSYVPFEKESIWKRLQELAQYLLGHLNQKDAQAVQMAYGIFRYLTHGGRNVDEMYALILELEKKEPEQEEIIFSKSAPDERHKETDKEKTKKFPVWRWILYSLPVALAIFLCAYVAFNEWYLSDKSKILLLVAAAVFGGIGIMLWKKWGSLFKKERFFDDEDISDIPKLIRTDTDEEISIWQTPAVIGKLPDVAQILIQEPTVSRIHAKVTLIRGEYYIEDLNSKNGTYVNGRRLEAEKPARLEGNDELAFADIRYYFQLSNR